HAASFLLIAGGVISLALYAWMPELLSAFFPQLMLERPQEFVALAQLLLIQPLLLGLSGVLTSVTQLTRRFVLFALSPVLYNIGIIVGAVVFYPLYGLQGIGMGVV